MLASDIDFITSDRAIVASQLTVDIRHVVDIGIDNADMPETGSRKRFGGGAPDGAVSDDDGMRPAQPRQTVCAQNDLGTQKSFVAV